MQARLGDVAVAVDDVLAGDGAGLTEQRQRAAYLVAQRAVVLDERMAPRQEDLAGDGLLDGRLVARTERDRAARARHHPEGIGGKTRLDAFALDVDGEAPDLELQVVPHRREQSVLPGEDAAVGAAF